MNLEIEISFTCRFIDHLECLSKFDIFIDLILIKNLHRSIRDDDRNEEENKLLIDHYDCGVSGRDEQRYWQQRKYVYVHAHHQRHVHTGGGGRSRNGSLQEGVTVKNKSIFPLRHRSRARPVSRPPRDPSLFPCPVKRQMVKRREGVQTVTPRNFTLSAPVENPWLIAQRGRVGKSAGTRGRDDTTGIRRSVGIKAEIPSWRGS